MPLKPVVEIVKEIGIFSLLNYDGSCPCGNCQIQGINIETHCWRVGSCCKYSGVHVWIEDDDDPADTAELKAIAKEVKKQMKNIWFNTDWAIKLEPMK